MNLRNTLDLKQIRKIPMSSSHPISMPFIFTKISIFHYDFNEITRFQFKFNILMGIQWDYSGVSLRLSNGGPSFQ